MKMIAVVGYSKSGKTTIIERLVRLWLPGMTSIQPMF